MVPQTAQRSEHRDIASAIRSNAGLEQSIRTTAVAEIGAAARRLRQSNRWSEAEPLRTARPVAAVAPVRVVNGERASADPDSLTAKRVHPAGGNLPRRLRLV